MVGCQTLPCTPIRALVLCWSATVTSSGPARRVGKIPLIFRLLCFSFFLPPSLFSACFCRRRCCLWFVVDLFLVSSSSLFGLRGRGWNRTLNCFLVSRERLQCVIEQFLGSPFFFFFSCGRGSPTTLPQLLPLHLRMTKVLSAIFTRP